MNNPPIHSVQLMSRGDCNTFWLNFGTIGKMDIMENMTIFRSDTASVMVMKLHKLADDIMDAIKDSKTTDEKPEVDDP
jgi:hypothetical protein